MIRISAEVIGEGCSWRGESLPLYRPFDVEVAWNLPSIPTAGDRVRLRDLNGVLRVSFVEWTQDSATVVGVIDAERRA